MRGRAAFVEPAEPRFADLAAPLEAMTGGVLPVRGVIEVTADAVEAIRAPSYHLVPGASEQGRVESAMAACGVRPRD